jgi:hypothetical protein
MGERWPGLDYQQWKPTYETLHRWLQIVGKLRVTKSPWPNPSRNSTLVVTSRGLSTTAIPLGDRILILEFDFIDHDLIFSDSTGRKYLMPLQNETAASFFARFIDGLKLFEVIPTFCQGRNEVMDTTHCTYQPGHAHNFFQVLVRVSNVLQEFRAEFIGESSLVHFSGGSFHLAVTIYSGKETHPHLPDKIVREDSSRELMCCGFSPGNETYPQAFIYAYAYPEPKGFSQISVPGEAFYHKDLQEFILNYEDVRGSDDPASGIRDFIRIVYHGTASLAGWERIALERSKFLDALREELNLKAEGLH